MNSNDPHNLRHGILVALSLISFSIAQPAAPQPEATDPAKTESVVLSPFQVSTERDYGYTAANTLAGGRLSTELQKTAASVSVLTRDFLDDIGAGDVQQALLWATNSVASSNSDVAPDAASSNSLNGQSNLAGNGNAVQIRGFSSTVARNYFPWFVNSDGYNTERIDIARGPNSMIFGDAAAGGLVNVSTKRARVDRPFYVGSVRISDNGVRRATVDLNQPLGGRLAVRANALRENSESWQDFFKMEREGLFLAGVFNVTPALQLRGEVEYGYVDRRSPALFLRDRTSLWNGTYTLASRLTGTTSAPASAGVTRVDTGGNANQPFNVLDFGNPSLGFLDWQGSVRTNGTAISLETGLPASSGGLPAVAMEESAMLGRREWRTLPYFGYASNIATYRGENEYWAVSGYLEKSFKNRLFLEVAGAAQLQDSITYTPASHNSVFVDVNEFLPVGVTVNGSNRNPNFLKPYVESTSSFSSRAIPNDTDIYEGRVAVVYLLDLPFTRQRLGAAYSYRRTETDQAVMQLYRVNGTNPNLTARANQLFFRSYLSQSRGETLQQYMVGEDYTFANNVLARFEATGGTGRSRSITDQESLQAFMSGGWLKNDLITTLIGVRRDTVDVERAFGRVDTVSQRALREWLPSATSKGRVDSPTFGVVVSPIPALSVFASTSKTFLATPGGNAALDINAEGLPLRRGDGQDYGVKFRLLGGRVSGTLAYYESFEQNTPTGQQGLGNSINNIARLLGAATNPLTFFNDTQDVKGSGYEFDVTANVTRNWSLSVNVSFPKSELSNSLLRYRSLIAANRSAWETAANNSANPSAVEIRQNLDEIDIVLARNRDGLPRVNQTDFIANAFTRYRFSQGRLRGLFIGGGVNVVGDRLMAQRAGLPADYSAGYHTFSALLGYERRWKKVTGTFQLNVSNLFDQLNFRYIALLPNGTPQLYRISDPRDISFTATFRF